MKIGLIGGGYWGKNLIREFNNTSYLKTVCEINQEMIEKYNIDYPNLNYTTNFQDILDDPEITAICISLPAELHYQFAKQSLEANKDVYVEKPITLDINQAKELIELANSKNKILMVGHLLHYHPAVIKMKEIINSNKLGKIKNIIANRLNLGKLRKHENVLWSFAPHDISVILSLCNNELPSWVNCNGNDYITSGVHDITNSILYFENSGIYVNMNVNWLNAFKEQKMTIICEYGMIVFDDMEKTDKLKIYYNSIYQESNLDPVVTKIKEQTVQLDLSNSPLLKECQHFVDCCLTRKQPITNGEEGLRVLTVLENLTTSLRQKKIIHIENKKYYSHETAIIDKGAIIGDGTKIWHYSHVCSKAVIGKGCNIGQNCYIGDGVILGDYCKVQNNVSIYAGVEAGNYVFFGPSCVLTNDLNPRGRHSKNGVYQKTILKDGVTLGANCTIVCGNIIGEDALIGAGAVVCKNVEPNSVMVGNPAKKIGTIDQYGNITK